MYSTSDTKITIASLHPYYVYEVSVAAVTIDTGPFSPVLIVTTDEAGNVHINYHAHACENI